MHKAKRIVSLLFVICWTGCALYSLPLDLVMGQDSPRTWTDNTGKYKIEATFVKVENGQVELKRADNGKVVKLPLSRLSDADKKYVSTMTTTEEQQDSNNSDRKDGSDKVLNQIKTKAKIQWSEYPAMDEEGNEIYDLEIVVELTGKPAEAAVKFGNVKLEKVEDDEGNEVKIGESHLMMGDFLKEMIVVKRPKEEFFREHPDNGISVKFVLDKKNVSAKKLKELKGSVDLHVGADIKLIEIDDVKSLLFDNDSHQVEDEQLESFGINIELALDDDPGLLVRSEGKLGSMLDILPTNEKGEEHPKKTGHYQTFGLYAFNFDGNEVPEDLKIVIKVAEGGEILTVPFEFENLKVPAAKK